MSPANRQPRDRQLASLVSDESAAVQRFLEVLEEEQRLLLGTDLDALMPLAERKAELAKQVAILDDRRQAALIESGLAAGGEGMASWFASLGDPGPRAVWEKTLQMAARARDLNAENGVLINERLRHNQQALTILMEAGRSAALYGPDGQPRLKGGGRPLGSA